MIRLKKSCALFHGVYFLILLGHNIAASKCPKVEILNGNACEEAVDEAKCKIICNPGYYLHSNKNTTCIGLKNKWNPSPVYSCQKILKIYPTNSSLLLNVIMPDAKDASVTLEFHIALDKSSEISSVNVYIRGPKFNTTEQEIELGVTNSRNFAYKITNFEPIDAGTYTLFVRGTTKGEKAFIVSENIHVEGYLCSRITEMTNRRVRYDLPFFSDQSTTGLVTTCNFQCNDGYLLNGNSTVSCSAFRGKTMWPVLPSCVPHRDGKV